MERLGVKFRVKSILLDESIKLQLDEREKNLEKSQNSNTFYEQHEKDNPFHSSSRNFKKSRLGSSPTHEELEARCYTPIMIHSYLGTTSGVSDEKEIVLSSSTIKEETIKKSSSILKVMKEYNIDCSSCSTVDTSFQLCNGSSISLMDSKSQLPLDCYSNNYNVIFELYLSMLNDYNVICGVDFGKITLNLFELMYLVEVMMEHSSSTSFLSNLSSFKSLNNLVMLKDGSILLFLNIFPLITPMSLYSNDPMITDEELLQLNENAFFIGSNIKKLSREHSKAILRIDSLSIFASSSVLSVKNIGNKMSNIFETSKFLSNSSSLYPMQKKTGGSKYDLGSKYGDKNEEDGILQIGSHWKQISEEEINFVTNFMSKYKYLTMKYEQGFKIFMPKSQCISCVTTPSQNSYYNSGILFPLFSYVINQDVQLQQLTNDSFWRKILYAYTKHYYIEKPNWIQQNINNKSFDYKKKYTHLMTLEKEGKFDILENMIILEFINLFDKLSIDDQLSHTMNLLCFYVHVVTEYVSDCTIISNGKKKYIELFGDALKLGNGDCEDETAAIIQLIESFSRGNFTTLPLLKTMQTLILPYIPFLMIEGTEGKRLDDSKDSEQETTSRGKSLPTISGAHSSLKMIPIPYFLKMYYNWNDSTTSVTKTTKDDQIIAIVTEQWLSITTRIKKENLPYYNWLMHGNNSDNLPILFGEGTGMLESGVLTDDLNDVRAMINCCPAMEKMRKKFYTLDRSTSPFYVALFLGITNFFIDRGYNQGFFFFATKLSKDQLEDDEEQVHNHNHHHDVVFDHNTRYGKGCLFSDFMNEANNVAIVPNLSSPLSAKNEIGVIINELKFVNLDQAEAQMMKIIKESIINKPPLPTLKRRNEKQIDSSITDYLNNYIHTIPHWGYDENYLYAVVSHYVLKEYIDDNLFQSIRDYFTTWNDTVCTATQVTRSILKQHIQQSKLYLMDVHVNLEMAKLDPNEITCLNPSKDIYRFDFIIGQLKKQ